MKEDLTKVRQWEIVIAGMSCEVEVNDGEDMVEVDEVAIGSKTLDPRKSKNEPMEPNDNVFLYFT